MLKAVQIDEISSVPTEISEDLTENMALAVALGRGGAQSSTLKVSSSFNSTDMD